MRPVPIEPSELLKRGKRLKKREMVKSIENKKLIENKTKSIPPQNAPPQSQRAIAKEPEEIDPYPDIPLIDASDPSVNRLSVKNELTGIVKSYSSRPEEPAIVINKSTRSVNKKAISGSIRSSLDVMAHTVSQSNMHLNVIPEKEAEKSGCIGKMSEFIDFSLFKSVLFLHFAVSNFLTSLGFNAPYIYITDQATSMGIDVSKATFLLSTIGISNTVGRVVLGLLADIKGCNRLYLYSTVLTIAGIATMMNPLCTGYISLTIYAAVFGFMSGKEIVKKILLKYDAR